MRKTKDGDRQDKTEASNPPAPAAQQQPTGAQRAREYLAYSALANLTDDRQLLDDGVRDEWFTATDGDAKQMAALASKFVAELKGQLTQMGVAPDDFGFFDEKAAEEIAEIEEGDE